MSNITHLTFDPLTRLDFSSVQLSDVLAYFLQMYHDNNSYRDVPLTLLLSLGRCTQRVFKFVPAVERTDCLARKKYDSCAAKIQTVVGTISMRALKGLRNTVSGVYI